MQGNFFAWKESTSMNNHRVLFVSFLLLLCDSSFLATYSSHLCYPNHMHCHLGFFPSMERQFCKNLIFLIFFFFWEETEQGKVYKRGGKNYRPSYTSLPCSKGINANIQRWVFDFCPCISHLQWKGVFITDMLNSCRCYQFLIQPFMPPPSLHSKDWISYWIKRLWGSLF